ncbi:MAG: ROK family protein [Firmicutes bacterium]|nr:ROK family protein [Bacillota bacterium]
MEYRIGVDIGGTKIAAGLVNEEKEIVLKKSVPTRAGENYSLVVSDIADLIQDILDESHLQAADLSGIGIGCAGASDKESGIVLFSNNLGWRDVPLVPELKKRFDVPIHIDNDANAAALGEVLAGSAKGSRSCVMITLGTGVGGGIILDGKVYDGVNHAGGEVGHTVIVSGGEMCTCGRRGCFEAYASTTALIRMAKKAATAHPESRLYQIWQENGDLNGIGIFTAYHENDQTAKDAVAEYLFYVAEGVTNLVNIFQPEKIVIGGGICAQGDVILEPVRRQLAQDVFCKEVSLPDVVQATLGNDAGIIGAAYV